MNTERVPPSNSRERWLDFDRKHNRTAPFGCVYWKGKWGGVSSFGEEHQLERARCRVEFDLKKKNEETKKVTGETSSHKSKSGKYGLMHARRSFALFVRRVGWVLF